MPELPPLPHRPARPVLLPRTEDVPVVVARAARRRRRQAGLSGAVAASLVGIFLAFSQGGVGTNSLVIEPAGPGGGGGLGAGTPTASAPPSSSAASRPPGSTSPGGPRPDGTSRAGPDGSDAPSSGASSPEPGPGPGGGGPGRPAVRRDEVALTPGDCDRTYTLRTVNGWCVMVPGGPYVVQSGETRDYALLACRDLGRGSGTLTFDTEQEVEFEVYDGQRKEWHWSGGYKFPTRSVSVTVAEARCARWTVSWDTVGNDGDLLPPKPGYLFQADVMSADVDAPPGGGGASSSAPYVDLEITA